MMDLLNCLSKQLKPRYQVPSSLVSCGFFNKNTFMMEKETWKPIDEFNGDYDVSNLGNVRSWIKQGRDKPYPRRQYKTHGYSYCNFKTEKKYFARRIHRLVAIAFIPNTENKPCVNHKNGIKDDNCVENLEWVTNSENDIHAFDSGLREPMKGEMNGHSKITNKDVLEIRELCVNSDLSQREIGERYGISQSVVSEIHNRNYWSHV